MNPIVDPVPIRRRRDAFAGALLSVHLFVSVASVVLGKAARDAISSVVIRRSK